MERLQDPKLLEIKFSKHAIRRAAERGLSKYVNKKTFYYEAEFLDLSRASTKDCIYAYITKGDKIIITTMYENNYQ